MLSQLFDKPVRVWVGLGFPRQLDSVGDAYQFVMDRCGNSPEQTAAIRACRAALAGEIEAETARGIVVQFARKKNILVEDGPPPPLADAGAALHA
jgi:hypothetical protein